MLCLPELRQVRVCATGLIVASFLQLNTPDYGERQIELFKEAVMGEGRKVHVATAFGWVEVVEFSPRGCTEHSKHDPLKERNAHAPIRKGRKLLARALQPRFVLYYSISRSSDYMICDDSW